MSSSSGVGNYQGYSAGRGPRGSSSVDADSNATAVKLKQLAVEAATEPTTEPAVELAIEAASDASDDCHILVLSPALTHTVPVLPMP